MLHFLVVMLNIHANNKYFQLFQTEIQLTPLITIADNVIVTKINRHQNIFMSYSYPSFNVISESLLSK